MKTQRQITIDLEIHQWFKAHPGIKVSPIVNEFLKEYMEKNTE